MARSSLAGVLVLADIEQVVARHDEAAVTGGVPRLETERHDGGALAQGLAQLGQRIGADQRRVGIDHDDVVVLPRQRLAGAEHRMPGAEPLPLDEDFHVGVARSLLGHPVAVGTDDDGDPCRSGRHHGFEHMAQHRPVGDLVQNLRPVGAHPRAFPGRQHDGEAGPLGLVSVGL